MVQQPTLVLKTQSNDRTYEFLIPVGAPYGEVYDALFAMLKEMQDLMAKAAEQAKAPTSNEPVDVPKA